MRRGAMILAAATAFMLIAGGCERKAGPEDPKPFDPETAAPPSGVVVKVNEKLLGDQGAIGRQAKRAAEEDTGASASEGTAGGLPPIGGGDGSPAPADEPPDDGATSPDVESPPLPGEPGTNLPPDAPTDTTVEPDNTAPEPPAEPEDAGSGAPPDAPDSSEPDAGAGATAGEPPADDESADVLPKATGDPAADVKATIEALAKTAGGMPEVGKIIPFLAETDAKDARGYVQAKEKNDERFEELIKLAREKVAGGAAEQLMQMGGGAQMMFPPPGMELGYVPVDQLDITSAGGKVNVKAPGMEFTFVKSGDVWKLQYNAKQKKVLAALVDYGEARTKFIQDVTQKINSGAITSENQGQQIQDAHTDTLGPAMEKAMRVYSESMEPPR